MSARLDRMACRWFGHRYTAAVHRLGVCTRCGEQRTGEAGGRDLTRHEWALVITAVVTLAAIAALTLIALGKGWL